MHKVATAKPAAVSRERGRALIIMADIPPVMLNEACMLWRGALKQHFRIEYQAARRGFGATCLYSIPHSSLFAGVVLMVECAGGGFGISLCLVGGFLCLHAFLNIL